MAPRRGKALEITVAALEALCAKSNEITVESPEYLTDIKTGRKREFDVVARFGVGLREFKVAFECKDLKHKVGSEVVEGFRTKLDDSKIDLGVIVSSSGFTEEAVLKAGAHKIELQTVDKASDYSWLETAGALEDIVEIIQIDLHSNRMPVSVKSLRNARGERVSQDTLVSAISMLLLQHEEKWIANEHGNNSTYVNSFDLWVLGVASGKNTDGRKVSADNLIASVKFSYSRTFTPFGFFVYTGRNAAKSFAKADLAISNHDQLTQLVLVKGEADRVRIQSSSSSLSGSSREYFRLVGWDNVLPSLAQTGWRHQVQVSPSSDLESLSRLFWEAEHPDLNPQEFTSENLFTSLREPGIATVVLPKRLKELRSDPQFIERMRNAHDLGDPILFGTNTPAGYGAFPTDFSRRRG